MAKFVKQTSDLAESLNRLQGFAENLISMETNRRIQLGREKEARMVEAYGYMLGNEDQEIADLEASLQSIEQNLQSRGVELKSLSDEHKTISSEELLAAANEGAVELLNARLEDSRGHRNSLQKRKTEASAILRQINLFDDAMTLADPKHYGDPNIIDAEDVAHAGLEWMTANEQEGPEIMQRLEALQTESELERLQTDYYAKLARESEQKLIAAQSDFATADIRRERFEIVKKEALEAANMQAMNPLMAAGNTFARTVSLEKEIGDQVDAVTGESLNASEVKAKQQEELQEYLRLGVTLYPWATEGQAILEAKNLRQAMIQASNGKYQALINYLKEGYTKYTLWSQDTSKDIKQRAQTYKEDVKSLLDIDIDDKDWLQSFEKNWNAAWKSDIEQGEQEVIMSIDMFSEPLIDESEYGVDPLLKEYGFE